MKILLSGEEGFRRGFGTSAWGLVGLWIRKCGDVGTFIGWKRSFHDFPDINAQEGIDHYASFMRSLVDVVLYYDGSLKAEHGTGRNMAPFVKDEWGEEIYELMWKIKRLFDPENILNPGVLLNRDPDVFIKNLKQIPLANELIDKCIECGFCEIQCPSRHVTLTPRQRIVIYRELSALAEQGGNKL